MNELIRTAALLAIMAAVGGCASGTGAGNASATPSLVERVAYASEIAQTTMPSRVAHPATAPITDPAQDADDEESDESAWKTITTVLAHNGARKDAVLIVTVPRDDLFVAIDGADVPTAAGVESSFSFWHCSCGKTTVIGQFCVADYESNDVIDALRAGHLEVSSIGPMVLHSRVSPLILRFQGEGRAADIAKTLKEALSWTGRNR